MTIISLPSILRLEHAELSFELIREIGLTTMELLIYSHSNVRWDRIQWNSSAEFVPSTVVFDRSSLEKQIWKEIDRHEHQQNWSIFFERSRWTDEWTNKCNCLSIGFTSKSLIPPFVCLRDFVDCWDRLEWLDHRASDWRRESIVDNNQSFNWLVNSRADQIEFVPLISSFYSCRSERREKTIDLFKQLIKSLIKELSFRWSSYVSLFQLFGCSR